MIYYYTLCSATDQIPKLDIVFLESDWYNSMPSVERIDGAADKVHLSKIKYDFLAFEK